MGKTSLSKGEVVTFITNKTHNGIKGSFVAVIFSIKMRDIVEHLETSIPQQTRDRVREVTTDLSSAMMAAAQESFRYATNTIDRFHVQMLVNEATDNLRLKAKRKKQEIKKIKNKTFATKMTTLLSPMYSPMERRHSKHSAVQDMRL